MNSLSSICSSSMVDASLLAARAEPLWRLSASEERGVRTRSFNVTSYDINSTILTYLGTVPQAFPETRPTTLNLPPLLDSMRLAVMNESSSRWNWLKTLVSSYIWAEKGRAVGRAVGNDGGEWQNDASLARTSDQGSVPIWKDTRPFHWSRISAIFELEFESWLA